MKKLLSSKKYYLAKLLSNNSRYIDDINTINYKGFNQKAKEIYPAELLLERNGNNDKDAVYLDVRVTIKDDEIETGIYNKTDYFNFPVVTFTFLESNIPHQLGYQVFYGQVLRYSNIFSNRKQFMIHCSKLFNTLKGRGYKYYLLLKSFRKVFNKNVDILFKFGIKSSKEAGLEMLESHQSIH